MDLSCLPRKDSEVNNDKDKQDAHHQDSSFRINLLLPRPLGNSFMLGFHTRSQQFQSRYVPMKSKQAKTANQQQTMAPLWGLNSSLTTTLHQTAVENIKSRRIDASIPAVASSDMQIQTRSRGQPTVPTEVPPRSSMQR